MNPLAIGCIQNGKQQSVNRNIWPVVWYVSEHCALQSGGVDQTGRRATNQTRFSSTAEHPVCGPVYDKYLRSRLFSWKEFRRAYHEVPAVPLHAAGILTEELSDTDVTSLAGIYRSLKRLQLKHRGSQGPLTVRVRAVSWKRAALDIMLAAIHIQLDRTQINEPADLPAVTLLPPPSHLTQTMLTMLVPSGKQRHSVDTGSFSAIRSVSEDCVSSISRTTGTPPPPPPAPKTEMRHGEAAFKTELGGYRTAPYSRHLFGGRRRPMRPPSYGRDGTPFKRNQVFP